MATLDPTFEARRRAVLGNNYTPIATSSAKNRIDPTFEARRKQVFANPTIQKAPQISQPQQPQQSLVSKATPIAQKFLSVTQPIFNVARGVENAAIGVAKDIKNVFLAPFKDVSAYIKVQQDPKAKKEYETLKKEKAGSEKFTELFSKYGGPTKEQKESSERGSVFGMGFTQAAGNVDIPNVGPTIKYLINFKNRKSVSVVEKILPKIKDGENTPGEIIGGVIKSGQETTPEGKAFIRTAVQAKIQDQNIIISKPKIVYRGQVKGEESKGTTFFTDSKEQAGKYANVTKGATQESEVVTKDIQGLNFKEVTKKESLDALDNPEYKNNFDGIKFEDNGTTSYAVFKKTTPLPSPIEAKGAQGRLYDAEKPLTNQAKKVYDLKDYPGRANSYILDDGKYISDAYHLDALKKISPGDKDWVGLNQKFMEEGNIRHLVLTENVPGRGVVDNFMLELSKKPTPAQMASIEKQFNSIKGSKAITLDITKGDRTNSFVVDNIGELKKVLNSANSVLPTKLQQGNQNTNIASRIVQNIDSNQSQKFPHGQSIPKNVAEPPLSDVKVKPEEVKAPPQSRVFERLQKENPEQLQGELPYDRAILKKEFDSAARRIVANKQQAYEEAMGRTATTDIKSVTTNIEMAEQALKAGDNVLYEKLTRSRSIAQTRRGQAIVAEKGSVEDNSVARYVKDLVSSRLETLGKKYLSGLKEGDTIKKRAVEIIDGKVEQLDIRIKKGKLDVKTALKLLDELTCLT